MSELSCFSRAMVGEAMERGETNERRERKQRTDEPLTLLFAHTDTDPELYDVSALPPSVLEALEADSFWCLSKLLDGIQDNYIFAQPGIQRQVKRMRELCERVDGAFPLPSSSLLLPPSSFSHASPRFARTRTLSYSFSETRLTSSLSATPNSSTSAPPRIPLGRIHPIRLPVDELPIDERDERQVHR